MFAEGNWILYFKMPLPHIVPLKELDRFGQSWTYFMFQDSEVGTRCGNPVINFYMLLQSLCQCTMVKHIQLQSKEISIIKTFHTKNKNVTEGGCQTKSSKRVGIFLGKKWDWVRHAKMIQISNFSTDPFWWLHNANWKSSLMNISQDIAG